MGLYEFRLAIREWISAGARDLNDIPVLARGNLTNLALGAYEEALELARGKSADSREYLELQLVSRASIGRWEDQKEENGGL